MHNISRCTVHLRFARFVSRHFPPMQRAPLTSGHSSTQSPLSHPNSKCHCRPPAPFARCFLGNTLSLLSRHSTYFASSSTSRCSNLTSSLNSTTNLSSSRSNTDSLQTLLPHPRPRLLRISRKSPLSTHHEPTLLLRPSMSPSLDGAYASSIEGAALRKSELLGCRCLQAEKQCRSRPCSEERGVASLRLHSHCASQCSLRCFGMAPDAVACVNIHAHAEKGGGSRGWRSCAGK